MERMQLKKTPRALRGHQLQEQKIITGVSGGGFINKWAERTPTHLESPALQLSFAEVMPAAAAKVQKVSVTARLSYKSLA